MVQLTSMFKLKWISLFVVLFVSAFLQLRSHKGLKGIKNVHAKEFSQRKHPYLSYSFFPWPFLIDESSENAQLKAMSVQHDIRLLPTLWLHIIRKSFEEQNFENLAIPFQWQSLLDLKLDLLPPEALEIHNVDLADSSRRVAGTNRSEYVNASLGPVEKALDEHERAILSNNYLSYLYDFQPHMVVCLGLVKDDLMQIKVEVDKTLYVKSVLDRLVSSYQNLFPGADHINAPEEIIRTRKLLNRYSKIANLSFHQNPSPSMSDTQQSKDMLDFSFPYNVYDFLYVDPKKMRANASPLDILDRILLKNCLMAMESPTKYFHEAHLLNTTAGFHFDWRFFRRVTYNAYEHNFILHRLARAWLQFCESAKLTSWLAHGSLLGWYWNGLNFPWDEDIDVQMTAESLYKLAKHYNQSIVIDYSNSDEDTTTHQYFIDVNPHFMNVVNSDSANVIDARFIDLQSGMYVDITALTATRLEVLLDKKLNMVMHSLINPAYSEIIESASANPKYLEKIHEQLKVQELDALSRQEIVNCKNKHLYHTADLFPLKNSSFEGVSAYVPFNFESILKKEYPKGLLHKHYMNWSFRPYLAIWLPDGVCKGDHYGRECKDENAVLESYFTREFRLKRGEALRKESRVRYDPFMIERNRQLFNSMEM